MVGPDKADLTLGKWSFEPALILYVVNTLVSVLVSFGLNLSMTQTATISTISTAVLGLVAAFLVRPIVIPTVTAAISTVLVGVAAFGWHLPPEKITGVVTVVGLILGLITRQLVVPNSKAKLGLAA